MHSASMAAITALSSVRSSSGTKYATILECLTERPLKVNYILQQTCQYAKHAQSLSTQYSVWLAISQSYSRIHMPVAELV